MNQYLLYWYRNVITSFILLYHINKYNNYHRLLGNYMLNYISYT